MKRQRGITGVAGLWILTALSTMAFASLEIGRWYALRGRQRVSEQQAIAWIAATNFAQRDENFAAPGGDRDDSGGRLHFERRTRANGDIVFCCDARVGRTQKRVDVTWQRRGDRWRAVRWTEMAG